MTDVPAIKTRRRGAELEGVLLDAAWQQLVAEGYGHFTIEAVAERARTSKHVLYRRWDRREQLLRAAIRHHGGTTAVTVPDSGDLRQDLFAVLRAANTQHSDLAALFSALLSSHYDDIGMTPAELRAELLRDRATAMEQVIDRAVRRGDIDPGRLTPRIAQLPFTLFRHEYFMTLTVVSDDVLAEIIDDVFLPLVSPR